jgi:hypothetical protein
MSGGSTRPFTTVSILGSILLALCVQSSEAAQRPESPPALGSLTRNAAPGWLAWKVFHESLIFYSRQSIDQVNDVLRLHVGLEPPAVRTLLNAGQAFAGALDRIDAAARAEVQRRYGSDKQPPPGHQSSSRPIVRRPGKTLQQMAVEDGLYAQVESEKNAVLARHLADLTRSLGVENTVQLGRFVNTAVAPHIKTFVEGEPTSDLDPTFSGNVFTPRQPR